MLKCDLRRPLKNLLTKDNDVDIVDPSPASCLDE